MVTTKNRDQTILHTDIVRLQAQFKDATGTPADLDSFPTITIVQPSGNVVLGPTSTGVMRLDVGLYAFDYTVGINDSIGVWTDIWEGVLSGIPISGEFLFVIHNTQLPSINTDGYKALGDDPGFNYSQLAICNINDLLKLLKARLDSAGKAKFKDEFGNYVYVDCDIYSVEQLVTFLVNSLSMFNQIPHFTFFTFEDTEIVQQFAAILVEGAVIWALGSKALLERGREFQITDQGLNFNPPTVSELMQTEWSNLLNHHKEVVKEIKANMKPSPYGLGTFTISTSRHPAIRRLRHLRARQII